MLIFQVWQEFSGHANQAKQIGLNFRKHRRIVDGFLGREIVSPLIVKDAVQAGKFFDGLSRCVPYGSEIRNIQNEMPHSGI